MEDVVRKSICAAKKICKDVDEVALGNAAKLLYDTCNKPGFIIDFDVVWKLLKYARKDSAKRKLLQYFTEGIDYETRILKNVDSRNKGHTGGKPEENFMLTSEAFSSFCQMTNTPIGKQVRIMYHRMSVFVKELQEAIKRGEVTLTRNSTPTGSRPVERVKAGNLHTLCHEVVGQRVNGMGHGIITGDINKASTGRYKYELARELNKPSGEVNLRDYMTRSQLSAAGFLQSTLIDACEEADGEIDIVKFNRESCEKFAQAFGDLIHGKVSEKKLPLRNARQAVQAIEAVAEETAAVVEQPTIIKKTTIQNYFAVVNQTNNN